jgi:hypothetical protein
MRLNRERLDGYDGRPTGVRSTRKRVASIALALLMTVAAAQAAQALPSVIPFDGPEYSGFTYGFDITNPDLDELATVSAIPMAHWLLAVPSANPYGNDNDEILFFADVESSLYSRCADPNAPCTSAYNVYDITWTLELNENHPLVLAAAPGETFNPHLVLPGWDRTDFGSNQVNVFSDSFEVDGSRADVMVSSWFDAYFFLSLEIADMTPGAAGRRDVRLQYDMVGAEPIINGQRHVPSLQLTSHLEIVPEPGTFMLFGLGLAGLARLRSRDFR